MMRTHILPCHLPTAEADADGWRHGKEETVTCVGVVVSLLFLCWSEVTLALNPQTAITDYIQTVWDSEDGLPQNSITAIVQTPDGYIWLATYDGLVRWDGVRFVVFDESNSALKRNRILSLALGRSGDLWVGGRRGEG